VTRIVVSRALVADDFDETRALQLAKDFQEYKAGGSFGDPFGRDKAFLRPESAVANELWHVHIDDGLVTDTWDNLWSRGFPQWNFTSDTILVYGRMSYVQYQPYLLLTILKPDGHAQMDNPARMRALVTEYENEVEAYRERLPTDKWLILP
jgi:hypothetical protein